MSESALPTNPGAPPPWALPSACQRLDQYLLGPELGRGGMARVVEAWDTLLRRRVAIKLLHSSDPMLTVRFFREAQAQARLEHPNICRILELGNGLERPYLVLPLIQGRTLGDLRPELDPTAIARIMADVAGAVHFAHRAGLIHRDLKPQNILVEALPDGAWRPIVVDFGLARDFTVQDQTLTWAMVGTPAFMSPEQARGHHPTPAADIYSLGATQYALLSGGPPYEAATVAGLLTQQERQEAPRLRPIAPGLPRDLETITLKCLESNPSLRYESAFELESDLRRFLAGEPIKARPVTWVGRVWRQARRNRALAASILIGLACAGTLLGWNLHTRRLASRQVIIAQRFGMEIQAMESMLRVERMLPAHDMRPAEGRIRAQLAALQASMRALGPASSGPGEYALGRGFLALRQHPEAQRHLEAAWASGYRPPEVASALGMVHSEQYALGLARLSGAPKTLAAALTALLREHRDPALGYFALAGGAGTDSARFDAAHRAFLEDRFDDCITACREVRVRQPWRYEALILEAQAIQYGLSHSHAGRPIERSRAILQQALADLDSAQDLARSDIDVHRGRLNILSTLAVQESESGRPSLAPFRKAEAIFEEACRIEPADADLWNCRFYNALREQFIRLAAGEDIRPACRDLAQQEAQALQRVPHSRILDNLACEIQWLCAEAQWRRGEDPGPSLAEALRRHWEDPDEAEILAIQARSLAQRGRDPRPLTRRAGELLAALSGSASDYYYFPNQHGEILFDQANWEWWTGRNPDASLRQGELQLRRAIALNPEAVYPYFHLSRLLALRAEARLARGADPGSSVAEALAAGRRAVAIRPDHFRSQLGLAEAYLVEGHARSRQGGDAAASFRAAAQALARSRRLNPSDWRIALAEARLALARANSPQGIGGSAESWLLQAEAAARRGLAVKADAPELLWAAAEANRLRGDAGALARAAGLARQALALSPELAPARLLLRQLPD